MRTYPIIDVTEKKDTVLRFEKQDVIEAHVVHEVNPSCLELPYSTLEFKVYNRYANLTMFSGEAYDLLSQKLPVDAYINIDGYGWFVGGFFLKNWKNEGDDVISFKAVDYLGVLDEEDFIGFFASNPLPFWLLILYPTGLVKPEDDSIYRMWNEELSGFIPPSSAREALQQVCIASSYYASPITARSRKLAVGNASPYDQHVIDPMDVTNDKSIDLLPLVTKIELVSHTYSIGSQLEDIYEEYLEPGSYKIIFEKPYYDIVINGPGYEIWTLALESGDDFVLEDGATLLEIGGRYNVYPNSVFLEVTDAGTVTIAGYPWLDSKRSFIFTEDVNQEFENKNAIVITDATLVGLDNAQNVLNKLRDYFRERYKVRLRVVGKLIFAGDEIYIRSGVFGKKMAGKVTKSAIDLAGGLISDIEVLCHEYPYEYP